MIEVQNLVKSYGSLKVLKGVNLKVEKGKLVGILGKSGTGKSTFLHILGTLDQPDGGEVLINGQNPFKLNTTGLARFRNENIGFVFQFHHLLSEFSALENTAIPALIKKTDKKAAFGKAAELLDYLGLNDRMHHKPEELSGGEQQRVAVARALINDPILVLADEPTGNLDTSTSRDMHNLFVKLGRELSITFVIVTHNVELGQLCDMRYEMKDGLLSQIG
ncbi:MAG: ABC transporter ATP-binding protein [Saprospirales bacterium]|nr:MAG: ABC transporter ATP-binding protein [Saprospirales bacterium]